MEQFINDEIDMILDDMNDDKFVDNEITLTKKQRETICENIVNGYDYIWEDLYDAISGEITEITK